MAIEQVELRVFKALSEDQIREMKCLELTGKDGEYLCTVMVCRGDYQRGWSQTNAIEWNDVAGKDLKEILG